MTIEPFDLQTASDAELAAHHDLFASIDLEAVPGDEPQPLAEFAAWIRFGESARKLHAWAAWDSAHQRLRGVSVLSFWEEEVNQNLGSFWLHVRPEERRRGLARALLEPLVPVARAHGRTTLDVSARPAIPAGKAFLESLGGRLAFTGRHNALDMADVDVDLLHEWVNQAKDRASDYRVVGWDAPCPADRVDAFVAAQSIMNTAPTENFEVEDEVFSVAQLRAREQSQQERTHDMWVLAAVHEPTGVIAGYTELTLPALWPTRGYQGDTGVDLAHRNKGLGRWLKAAMLLRVLDERPAVKRITTHNAGSNEPMLNINHALGFHCTEENPTYQIPLDNIAARLAASR